MLVGSALLFVGCLVGLAVGYDVGRNSDPPVVTDGGEKTDGGQDEGKASNPKLDDEADDASGTGEYIATWPESGDSPVAMPELSVELDGLWSGGEANPDPEREETAREPVAAVWDDESEPDFRYRTLIENFPEGLLALFDEDGRYLITGGRLFNYIDHAPEDFVGNTIEESYADDFVDRYGARFDDVFEGEESTFEFRHGDRHFRKHLVPVWDGDTVDVGMEITKDITERKQREAALRESEQRYRTLAENFPHGSLSLFNEELRYRLVGGRLFEGTEMVPGDFAGKTVDEVYLEAFLENHRADYEAVFEGEESTFEFRYEGRDFRTHLVPVRDSQGRVEAGLDITEDITELRDRERALEQSEQRYRTLAENLPAGVVSLFDHDLRFEVVDGGIFDSIELDISDFEGSHIADVHTDGYAEMHLEKYRRCLAGERSSFTFTHDDHIYRTRLVPVRGESGEVIRGMSISTDVTDLKERERELQRQNERLEDFVGLVSHDLRNPLQVLRGRLQLLDDEIDSEHLDQATDATKRMEQLIDDMLALARQGAAVTDPESVAVADIARDAWWTADTGGATLDIETGDLRVEADPNRLRQLFENCYRNSVEHGSDDITVTVGRLQNREGFFLADDGPGIPEDEREAVLEKGYTTDDDGTGFGLAIVSEIAEAHGWAVTVTASENGGARFEFETNPLVAGA